MKESNTQIYNLNKVFTKLKMKQTFEIPKEECFFEYEFIKKGTINKNKRYFVFFENLCIFYQDKTKANLKAYAIYDFDLRIEWIYNQKKGVNLGKITGFKLMRGNDTSEIVVPDSEDFIPLQSYFKNRLNSSNFHGNYKAIKKIGKGNFANVYLVESLKTGTSYAVKAFSKEILFEAEKGRKSLINEINIMRATNHNNIIKLFEVYETDNSIYMVLELLEGGNLVDYLKNHGKFSEKDAAVYMKAILSGLKHIHSKNIMHRDLKPENILFRNNEITENNIVIVDFGLSTFVNEDEYLFSRCGTPGFVAPEVINLKDVKVKYDKICDIFSVGIIFHILIFGKSIFPGKTYNDILVQNRACKFDFNETIYDKLSPKAKDFLIKLLEVNPSFRITAEDALNHPFLNSDKNFDKSLLDSQELENLGMDEGHAASLNKSKINQEFTPSSPISAMFSPLKKENIIYNSTSEDDELKLVTRFPVLTGYTKTIDKLDSPGIIANRKTLLNLKNNNIDVQSPELRNSLKNNSGKSKFQMKLYQNMDDKIKDYEEEKN